MLREAEPSKGLSPRGRGNHSLEHDCEIARRSIPAWAGKPPFAVSEPHSYRVYPRVGGETLGSGGIHRCRDGLSPRGRGNRYRSSGPSSSFRSIPAWAGKPRMAVRQWLLRQVYPRVGGETLPQPPPAVDHQGLSPRGRGNLAFVAHKHDRAGSIPAWAGKPVQDARRGQPFRVYPRVGGETPCQAFFDESCRGLSPRGRGTPATMTPGTANTGSIPAWAGKPWNSTSIMVGVGVYPRVGGETLPTVGDRLRRGGLSPRGRGNHHLCLNSAPCQRSIPAWAGKPSPPRT